MALKLRLLQEKLDSFQFIKAQGVKFKLTVNLCGNQQGNQSLFEFGRNIFFLCGYHRVNFDKSLSTLAI